MRHTIPTWLVPVLAIACGGGGSSTDVTGPSAPDVRPASVSVTPATASVAAGETVEFRASARNAAGDVLTDASLRWEVSDPAIATVDSNGRATGLAEGSAAVRAISGTATGTATLQVQPNVTITAVEPSPLVPGESARITGRGFAAEPAGNAVMIGNAPAVVTSSTPSTVDVVVPDACLPEGPAEVRVEAGSAASDPFPHPFAPAGAPFALEPGAMTIRRTPAELCLRFEESAEDEAYLIGVQSVSEVPSTMTPVRVSAVAAGGATGFLAPAGAPRPFARGAIVPAARSREDELLRGHRRAEAELRARERRVIESGAVSFPAARRALRAGHRIAGSAVPAVGDVVPIRVPDIQAGVCNQFHVVQGIVRHVGEEGIWIEDAANPAGGFSDATYARLSDDFDSRVIQVLEEWYGSPTDLDGNGRVVIVITERINRNLSPDGSGVLAFVVSTDFFPQNCRASNGGEYYYAFAPDPAGVAGPAIPLDLVERLAIPLVAHEVTHVIQFGRRIETTGANVFPTPWEMEGQATFSEELMGHEFDGVGPGQNLPADLVVGERSDHNWYALGFGDLFSYYGFESRTSTIAGAPEECSFVTSQGPCTERTIYGVAWSFLRWLVDHFGDLRPGGPQAMHRAIIENTFNGYTTMQQITGQPIHILLAQWAATLYLDDRVDGLREPRLDFPGWNLFSIDQAVVDPARLIPRPRSFAPFTDDVRVRAGSTAYFFVDGARPATAIGMRSPAGTDLPGSIQVWVVRTR